MFCTVTATQLSLVESKVPEAAVDDPTATVLAAIVSVPPAMNAADAPITVIPPTPFTWREVVLVNADAAITCTQASDVVPAVPILTLVVVMVVAAGCKNIENSKADPTLNVLAGTNTFMTTASTVVVTPALFAVLATRTTLST